MRRCPGVIYVLIPFSLYPPQSVTGTAVTPSTYDEGVESNGDTWTQTATSDGQDWTKTFTNTLGEQYKVQETGPSGAVETATTSFDGNGRPDKTVGFDGVATFTNYVPIDGLAGATWEDVAGTGVYAPGVDPESNSLPRIADSNYYGETDAEESSSGYQSDFEGSYNAGLDAESVVDGQKTTTVTQLDTPEEGDTTVTTTNPDGTQVVDQYNGGRLSQEQTLGTDHSTVVTTTSYGYDALGRNNSVTDWTGKTSFTLNADGSVASVTYPDGRVQTVHQTDPRSGAPTQVTLPNGQDQNKALNNLQQQITQSGAGVIPARYGYDSATGAMTSLKLFQSGTLDSGTAETTTWTYDPATGLLTNKTFNDGTSDTYSYNAKSQLTGMDTESGTGALLAGLGGCRVGES